MAYLRKLGQQDFLIPLEQIFPHLATEKVFGYYRVRIPTKLATDSGEVVHPPERSDAGLSLS